MKVLFVNANDRERQIYSIYLDNLLEGLQVIEVISCKIAIEKLSMCIGKIDLVIYTNNTGDDGLYTFVREKYPQIPFVLFSSDLPDMIEELSGFKYHNPRNDNILTPVAPNDFKIAIIKILRPLRVTNSLMAFQRVKLIYFMRYNRVLCDVFIKLSDQKYVKVIKENVNYTKDDIDKLRSKNVEYLYIRNSDFNKFQVTLNKMPFLIVDTEGMSDASILDTISMSNYMLNTIISDMGFTQEAIVLAEKSVKQMINLVDRNTHLSNLLYTIRNKKDYLYDHSYLTAIVCCEILKQMDWSDDRNIDHLCMAALLHDVVLTNSDLALVQDQNDPDLKKFSKSDIKNYFEHPIIISNMLEKIEFIPTEVINIIRQHHEEPKGEGFPEKIHAMHLPVLSCTFILAHNYVKRIYKNDFDYQRNNEVIFDIKKRYNLGNFKGLIEAFAKFHSSIATKQAG
ncbi:MAG: HD domain-containing protein [Oligoflexia bacterium]|nr:HD domain-containing protein [Oligoflexia bacterium]